MSYAVFTDYNAWKAAVEGNNRAIVRQEFPAGGTPHPGVSFVSDNGEFGPAGKFTDNLVYGSASTTWNFQNGITAWGGLFKLSTLEFESEINVTAEIDLVGAISVALGEAGAGFWGFVSDKPLRTVRLEDSVSFLNRPYTMYFMVYDPALKPASTMCPCGCPSGAEAKSSSSCAASPTTPNSVLLSSGQFRFNLPLLSVPSLGGVGWSFGLNYLSGSGLDDLLGAGFNFPQNLRMVEMAAGYVALESGDHTQERFVDVGGGGYNAVPGNNTRAVLTSGGSGADDQFTLAGSDGTVTLFYGFDPAVVTPGRIKSVTDRHGNRQTYTWTTTGGALNTLRDQLASLTDSYGRTIHYRYFGLEFGYRLREIEDCLGRKLNFQYDATGRLVAVVTPTILRAAEGNTFPGGTAYVFQYDTHNPRPERRGDLIKIWYPNQATPFIDVATRTVDVSAVHAQAAPRYVVEYGQDPTDYNTWGRVVRETVGDPAAGVGGTYRFAYTTAGLLENIVDAEDPIVCRTTLADRNGNMSHYDFNAAAMPVRHETLRNRRKLDLPPLDGDGDDDNGQPSFVTWTKFNANNQPLLVIYPAGNSVEYTYDDGLVDVGYGPQPSDRRLGLLKTVTRKVDNPLKDDPTNPIPALYDGASNGQTQLTMRYFYDPLFNQQCAVIEPRGNPIDGSGTYFTPQNGGDAPTDVDRSRFATITLRDYQQNQAATVAADTALQALLQLSSVEIAALIDFVSGQMQATDGSGGLPAGFVMNLGDINADGTGDGATSGLPPAPHRGNVVRVTHPDVRQIGAESIGTQQRAETFTTNARGQVTTHTDSEGNLTVTTRYPLGDPEGDGRFVAAGLGSKQYGQIKAIYNDADPDDVLSLVGDGGGNSGDLLDFIPGAISRANTPGVYQNLVTCYEGSALGPGAGCAACAYDALGNPLAVTDPRGFTTHLDRNELGRTFRTRGPDPYRYLVESFFDANGNITRVDTEDQYVQYASNDPTSADYAHFVPTGSGSTAQVPSRAGPFRRGSAPGRIHSRC